MNNIPADFRVLASKTPPLETFGNLDSSQLSGTNYQIQNQNPRKKRSKLIRVDPCPSASAAAAASSSSAGVAKAKPGKRADSSAPKITRPCSECGKKFWSWKALFGHMRCHPERQWRGINPPPNFRRSSEKGAEDGVLMMTEDDHEVAACLLMLANGTGGSNSIEGISHCMMECDGDEGDGVGQLGVGDSCRFECSSCKKVFGSHQALGGHRASHKNVKGCFAITKNEGEDEDRSGGNGGQEKYGELGEVKENFEEKMMMVLGHKCSICLRVFSSGQALGGHKRCHWEKVDEPPPPPPPPPPPSSSALSLPQGLNHFAAKAGFGLDLNLPAPLEDDLHCSHFSNLALDLNLGL